MDDCVFLKIFLYKGNMCYGKREKLSPYFVGPFEIREHVGIVAYRIALPPELMGLHNVVQVSMLKKYDHNPSHIIPHGRLPIHLDMSYAEYLIKSIDRQKKVLRNQTIHKVKVVLEYHSP